MKYQQNKFILSVSNQKLTDLEYDLRIGKITPKEYERRKKAGEK